MKYVYPAIFTNEPDGVSVTFPDLPNCATSGETLPEALEMAADALALVLYDMEEDGIDIPQATDIRAVNTDENAFVSLITCDTLEYRKMFDSKAVKKTLTIPSWLNKAAERENINFSAVLQSALRAQLNL